MTAGIAAESLSRAVGGAIRRAREHEGLSMRALALRCGMSQPFLSEVERGISMPSIATLYRIAEALGIAPSTLVPSAGGADVVVVRADEGQRVPSSERPGSAVGRVVLADETRGLEVYEYRARRDEDLDVWFRHEGDKVLHVIEGRLLVEFDQDGEPPRTLGPGDTIVHAGRIPHRWVVVDEPVRLYLVITRPGRG